MGRWQIVHAIDFTLANGSRSNAIGILVLDDHETSSVLTTVEGLTLFEAHAAKNGALDIKRALPPFDHQEFASGLMRDVRTIFQKPRGEVLYGQLDDGTQACRHTTADGEVTDILPSNHACWRMNTYTANRSLSRAISASPCGTAPAAPFPQNLELVVPGPKGYTLRMRLISAERLNVKE